MIFAAFIEMLQLARKIQKLILDLLDWLYNPFRNFLPEETFRYAATGSANTALDIGLYFIFYNYVFHKQVLDLGFLALSPYIAAFVFVFPITFISGFILAKYITFTQSSLRGTMQLFRYGMTVAGAIFLNYLLLKLFVEQFHIFPTPSKMITTVIVVAYSYLLQRYFTFKTGQLKKVRLKP